MTDTIQINMPFRLIQQVRLVHAIAESRFPVVIPRTERAKFDVLTKVFGLQFATDASHACDVTRALRISHQAPVTSLGAITRPLIFPYAITDYCRSLWPASREDRFSFQGLVTGKRRQLLKGWMQRNLTSSRVSLPVQDGFVARLRRKFLPNVLGNRTRTRRVGDLVLSSSERGRVFPTKAWDDEYFRALARSQFVLCPSGDFIWSYRFFESILCGAIPIVEESCPAYDGFRVHSMKHDARLLQWSLDDAEHNYNLCVERLTIPRDELDAEIARLVDAKHDDANVDADLAGTTNASTLQDSFGHPKAVSTL